MVIISHLFNVMMYYNRMISKVGVLFMNLLHDQRFDVSSMSEHLYKTEWIEGLSGD